MESVLNNLYEKCLSAMEEKNLVIPRCQIDSLKEEMERLEIVVGGDDFDSEFGTSLMREQQKRYLQLIMLFERHEMGMRSLNKIVTVFQDNLLKGIIQEVEINDIIMKNILATSIGQTYYQFNQ